MPRLKETQVTVKSISGLKVEQVQDKFANDLNRASDSHVIVHTGTNNVDYSSVGTLLSSYEDLAEHLKQKCDKVGFSSIILRNDKPELNGKIELLKRSTQRAVLQKSCSTVGILLGKLIHFYVLLAR